MDFIKIGTGIVRKDAITGLIKRSAYYPWNEERHYDIVIHLHGTEVCLKFDSEVERSAEFNRIVDELKRKKDKDEN